MTEHEVIPPVMEPGRHIKHIDTDTDEERWATIEDHYEGTMYCPYCGEEVEQDA